MSRYKELKKEVEALVTLARVIGSKTTSPDIRLEQALDRLDEVLDGVYELNVQLTMIDIRPPDVAKKIEKKTLLYFAKTSDTSREAAISMHEIAPTLRGKVFRFIRVRGNATCDEIEFHLDLTHQTASARVYELKEIGVIADSGERRKTRSGRKATVWEVS